MPIEELLEYFLKNYGKDVKVESFQDTFENDVTVFHLGIDKIAEVRAFFAGFDAGRQKGSDEYQKNIQEVATQVYEAGKKEGEGVGYDKGMQEGIKAGIESERELSIIPSNAESIEVFHVHDNKRMITGKEAFVGYKLPNGNFHFIGIEYAVTSLERKGLLLTAQNTEA